MPDLIRHPERKTKLDCPVKLGNDKNVCYINKADDRSRDLKVISTAP